MITSPQMLPAARRAETMLIAPLAWPVHQRGEQAGCAAAKPASGLAVGLAAL
jgi:hypothetical protein